MDKIKDIKVPGYIHNPNVPYPQWLMYKSLLPKDICEKIIELAKKIPAKDATIFASDNKQVVNKSRKTQVRWILKDNEDFRELFILVDKIVRSVNEGFKVNCNNVPSIQFTEYLEPGYRYDWHHDIDWNRTDGKSRKISFVIQLCDPETYTGGNFEFKHHENPKLEDIRAQGTAICFLPYHEHRVTSIESGTRYSLVGWYEGPNWV